MRSREHSACLFVLSVLLISLLFGVSIASAGPVTIAEERLTTNTSDQQAPSVSGTRVVYEDQRDGDYSIFMWDVATDSERRITRDDGRDQRYPRISGDKIVFQDNSTGDWNIRVIDLTEDAVPGVGRRITADDSFDQRHPDISGSRIVFEDFRYERAAWSDPEIVLYDLATGKATRLTNDDDWHFWPVIWGDWVAYENSYDPASEWDSVSGLNIKNKVEKQLSADSVRAYRPAISGSSVVFEDQTNGDVRIFHLHTDSAESNGWEIPAPAGNQSQAEISGTKVVYTDDRNGNNELYLYDLTYHAESRMTNNASSQSAAALSGGRLVWEDGRNGHTDIYYGELILPRLSVSAPAVVAYGGTATLTGTLTTHAGAPIAGANVFLEMSMDGSYWGGVGGASVTNAEGRFVLTTPALYNARYVRAGFNGNVTYPSAQSSSRRVKPKAWVRTPIASGTWDAGTYHTVYGYLKPRHAADSYPVRIYRWKKTASGGWKKYGYLKARAYDYSDYTKYRRRMRFSTPGTWRLRAYAPADYWHAAAWSSGYDYVKVK